MAKKKKKKRSAKKAKSRPRARTKARRTTKKKKKSGKRRKPSAAFMKPVKPTSALAAVIGSKALPRTQVTKKLWQYIKRKKLQDRIKRRIINADAALKKVFGGKKSVDMFQMTKLVSRHLK